MDVIWILIEILVNIFENTIICYFIQKHFPGRFSKNTNLLFYVISVATIASVYTIYLFFPPPWILDTLGRQLFWFLYATLFHKGTIYKKGFWSILLVSVNGTCAVVVINCIMFITGVSHDSIIFGQGMFRFLVIVSAKTIQFFISYYFSRFNSLSSTLQKGTYFTLLSLPILCEVITTTLLDTSRLAGEDLLMLFFISLSSVCVMAILMVTYYLFRNISVQSEILMKTKNELHHNALMVQYNDDLIKIYANMRAWRHDLHNHLQTLLVLSRNGISKELEAYVADLGQQLKDVEEVCHTGRRALDAIVSAKCAIAKIDDIPVNLHITPISPIPVSDANVTSLLGNMFDNAIEACRLVDVKKRSIDLSFEMMGNMICIKMVNATDGVLRLEGERFLTTKSDERLHGLGLSSIDRIMDDADGVVRREHRDGKFITVLLIPVCITAK